MNPRMHYGLGCGAAARGDHLVSLILDQDVVFRKLIEEQPDRLVHLVEVCFARWLARKRLPQPHIGVHLLDCRAGDLGHIRVTNMTAGDVEEPVVGLVRFVGELAGSAPTPHEVVGAFLAGRAGALSHGVVLDLLDVNAQRILGLGVVRFSSRESPSISWSMISSIPSPFL